MKRGMLVAAAVLVGQMWLPAKSLAQGAARVGPEGRHSPVATVVLRARRTSRAAAPDALMTPELQRWLLEGSPVTGASPGPSGVPGIPARVGVAPLDPDIDPVGGTSDQGPRVSPARSSTAETRSVSLGRVGLVSLRRTCTGPGTATSPGTPVPCGDPTPDPVSRLTLVRIEVF